jgi:hypothetical protein
MKVLQVLWVILSDSRVRAFVSGALSVYAKLVRKEIDEDEALGALLTLLKETL